MLSFIIILLRVRVYLRTWEVVDKMQPECYRGYDLTLFFGWLCEEAESPVFP